MATTTQLPSGALVSFFREGLPFNLSQLKEGDVPFHVSSRIFPMATGTVRFPFPPPESCQAQKLSARGFVGPMSHLSLPGPEYTCLFDGLNEAPEPTGAARFGFWRGRASASARPRQPGFRSQNSGRPFFVFDCFRGWRGQTFGDPMHQPKFTSGWLELGRFEVGCGKQEGALPWRLTPPKFFFEHLSALLSTCWLPSLHTCGHMDVPSIQIAWT